MMWAALAYLYLSGMCLAAHVASDAAGGPTLKKLLFIALWPAMAAPLYIFAMFKAATE